MTKILVKNGDWDKARAELGTVLEAKRSSFDAKFNAAFGAPKKAAEPDKPAKQTAANGVPPLPVSRKR